MALEVGPAGLVLLVLRLADQSTPAVIGLAPNDAANLAKEMMDAAMTARTTRKRLLHG